MLEELRGSGVRQGQVADGWAVARGVVGRAVRDGADGAGGRGGGGEAGGGWLAGGCCCGAGTEGVRRVLQQVFTGQVDAHVPTVQVVRAGGRYLHMPGSMHSNRGVVRHSRPANGQQVFPLDGQYLASLCIKQIMAFVK